LRCEYQLNPLGIDEVSPRFSWILQHPERNQLQSAYRILVSSSQELLEHAQGDLWDSGRVVSTETNHIPYSGRTLKARQQCHWRVQWWDSDGRQSDFSEVARFEMGVLKREDWSALWISKTEVKEFTSKGSTLLGEPLGDYVSAFALYLRKGFMLKDRPVRARVYICGLGYYELRINGRKVGDRVLEPAQTDYAKLALYSTFDVTSESLDSLWEDGVGRCAVGVILGNGRHIRSYNYGNPKLMMQLEVEYPDRSKEILVSDGTWKVSYGPLQENGIYFGERYDARQEMPGWDVPGFDDSAWENVVAVDGPGLASQMMEPIRVVQNVAPVRQIDAPDGATIFDFGQNFAGWVRISLAGPRGTSVRMRHAELLNDDNTLNVSPNQNAEATDIYILKGEGREGYEPRFTYHGFRYVEITGMPSLPALSSVEACVVHSDVETVGEFSCSHGLINKIHRNTVWGQLSNLMSIPTDCSQRDERQGWLGDAHLAAEESMFNFGMGAFYTKFLRDIQLAQLRDGSLPDTVPPYLGRLYPADPAWGAAYITLAWLVYQFYGDTRILERHFDAMRKYVDFLTSRSVRLIARDLGKYGDWCPPGSIAPKRTPVDLTSTWYFYHDTLLLSKIAEVLGRDADHRGLLGLAGDIREAFNMAFLRDGEYAAYRFAPVDRSPGQTSNVLPLYLDMVPPELKSRVLGRLLQGVVDEQDYHLDTGILGTRYILDVLTENGYADVAFKVSTQRTYPGWGYMVEEGATTLWERWEKITGGGMNSHNHIMFGSVDAWFYRVLAGLKYLEPGWKHIQFKPPVVAGLEAATATLKSIKGTVGVSWSRTDSMFSMRLVIPVGSTASVYVPRLWEGQQITEGQTEIVPQKEGEMSDGMMYVGSDEKYEMMRIGSGEYELVVRRPN
jgi:alpha-L-rhamnosidase